MAVEYAFCVFVKRKDPPPTNVLDMKLNRLMVRLQSLSFGECGVPFVAITPWSTWVVVSIRVSSMGQIEVFNQLSDSKPFMLNRITIVK